MRMGMGREGRGNERMSCLIEYSNNVLVVGVLNLQNIEPSSVATQTAQWLEKFSPLVGKEGLSANTASGPLQA